MMKTKLFSLFLVLVASVGTLFASVTIDGIAYNLNDSDLTAEVTYGVNYSGSVVIPNSIMYNENTYSVTSVGYWSFSGYTGLTSVIIPNSVTSIGNYAFCDCTNLTSIEIPNSVTSIGNFAFSGCSGLTSIEIPNSVTSIGNGAFADCTVLSYMTVAAGNTVYDSRDNCNAIVETATNILIAGCQNTAIPNSVTSIGVRAFYGCTGLTSVTIPNSVTSIGDDAFFGCIGLTFVTLGNNLLSIGDRVFLYFDSDWYFKDLNISIYVPCGQLVTYKAMLNNDNRVKYAPNPYTINKVAENGNISDTGTEMYTICDEALVTCTVYPIKACQFVQWSDGITDNPRVITLTQDTTLEAIIEFLQGGKCGHDSVLTWSLDTATMALDIIGTGALSEIYPYSNLIESVTIGNSVTSIGQYAFDGCNRLKNVVIGSSVRVIENYAFRGCSAIETITCYSQRPPTVNTYAFDNLPYSTIVYVPAEYLSTYQMHNFWGVYDVRPLGSTTGESIMIQYTDNNGVFMSDETIVFHFPVAPQIEGFTFLGWQPIAEIIDNIITIQAVYEAQNPTSAPAEVFVPDSNGTLKLIRNGNVYILRDGKTYTMQGQEVK